MRWIQAHPQRSFNTVTTNVPGPQFPLYCLGREMLAHLPYVPIGHGVRVGTAVMSYNGMLAFGVTGDLDSAVDVGVVADGIAIGHRRTGRTVTGDRQLAAPCARPGPERAGRACPAVNLR